MKVEPVLRGRSLALVGLNREELISVSAVADAAGAEWQAFGRVVDVGKLRVFDLVVCEAAVAPLMSGAGAPLLVIGAVDTAVANDFLLPPVREDEFLLRALRVLDRKAPGVAKKPVAGTPVILTADDDPTTTAIIRAVVTQNAMTCHVARDGREALELARTLLPDAIILDVNMPYRDGFEVLTAVRQEATTATIPVLMLTSVQQESDIVKAFRLGADDYVAKPFNPMELLARIKRLVQRI
jgi:CheY-like chemotaxis protein